MGSVCAIPGGQDRIAHSRYALRIAVGTGVVMLGQAVFAIRVGKAARAWNVRAIQIVLVMGCALVASVNATKASTAKAAKW